MDTELMGWWIEYDSSISDFRTLPSDVTDPQLVCESYNDGHEAYKHIKDWGFATYGTFAEYQQRKNILEEEQ